jgi:hypothetical protein
MIGRDVGFWPKADIGVYTANVRFWGWSGPRGSGMTVQNESGERKRETKNSNAIN